MSAAGKRRIFDPRLLGALIAAGIVAFALFLVLMAYAGDFRTGRDGRPHALSPSAVGFQGIVRLIELGDGKARLIRSTALLDTEDLVVVALEDRTDREVLRMLLERRRGKPTLLILPKWEVTPDPQRAGWVRRLALEPTNVTESLLEWLGKAEVRQIRAPAEPASGTGFMRGATAPLPREIQTIAGEGFTPLLRTSRGDILLARVRETPHYILADPDLLNNQGLKDPAAARAALAILAELNSTGAETVSFDLTLNGFVPKPNALKLAFEPPFLALTLALFVAALLAGLHGAFRFGPEAEEARALAFGKTALVENSAALFKIARREAATGGAYAELVRESAAHATGAHLALRDAELDAYLDRVSPASGPNFSTLVERARRAESRFDLVAAARALFQWKKDLIS